MQEQGERRIPERRRHRRFGLRLPLQVVRVGDQRVTIEAETENISSGGVLFRATGEFEIGTMVEYFVTLPPERAGAPSVRLHCVGKVVRVERVRAGTSEGRRVGVAATLERYEFVRPQQQG